MAKSDSVIRAFSTEHVTKITGMGERTLAYWDNTQFFQPQFASIGDGRSAIRVYSFRDLVSLRTLRVLKHVHKVSLQHLRIVLKTLSTYSDSPFSELTLRVHSRKVYFDEPDTGLTRSVVSGQYELLPIISIIRDVERAAYDLTIRSPEDFGRSEQHRNVSHNARVIAGTRVPVGTIERFIAANYTTRQILKEYPLLTATDIEAVRSNTLRAA